MDEKYSALTAQNEELLLENKRLKKELLEAQNANVAKESFLSSMSHDIRTPMNAIIGMTALAKKHIDEKSRVIDALDKIEIAGSHLLSLINDVLDMSRINSGRLRISEELFSLGDLLHETLTIVRPQAEQRHHSFSFDAGDILYESLYGDALRLRQIFVNIINNSVKYTNEHGKIKVLVRQEMRDGQSVLIFRCEDNGIGMSREFLERIFEPFERVSNSTLSGVEGTGLGMSIVKKLIEAMDGTIEVQSEQGVGTAVTVSIPMRYETLKIRSSSLEGKRLLIIEGDKAMQALYREYLGEFGIEYEIVENASGAISAVTEANYRGEGFSCAVLGRTIGEGGSIFELASYLHQADSTLVLVLISDVNWEAIEYRANRSGISAFIPVPFFRKSLINGIASALQTEGDESSDSGIPDLSGKRLLLVEDNLINREIAGEILSATGAQVESAENGREAVERFESSTSGYYDMILMDIQMPILDGYGATRKIRTLDRPDAASVPIWAMTANAFAEDIAKAKESGMDGHIAKPIDINELMQVLRKLS